MTANDIRNICLLGHGGSGKTTLAEQMLFMTKGTDRLGRTADGNTVCDYDAEEIKRQISISLAFAPVKYKDVRINVMDAPGNFDFSGEAVSAIRAAECAVLVGAAKDGLSVGMEAQLGAAGREAPHDLRQPHRRGQQRLSGLPGCSEGQVRPVRGSHCGPGH